MAKDYLPNTSIYIKQHPDMFRINTDTFLLGEYAVLEPNKTVLDIGTNNGALLLYASRFNPSLLVGIDLFDEAIKLAKNNLQDNNIQAELYKCKLQEFKYDKFDYIITNPPYFDTKDDNLKNTSEFLKKARHEEYLPINELMNNIYRLLKDDGKAYMVHDANRYDDIINNIKNEGLFIDSYSLVYDERKEKPIRILLTITKKEVKTKRKMNIYLSHK